MRIIVEHQLKGADPGENHFPKQAELDAALEEKKRLDAEYQKLSQDERKPTKDDVLYRDSDIEEVNDRFNEELEAQINGTLPSHHIYHLGYPNALLLSTGISNVPIELNSARLKAKATSYGHDYELQEIIDLPKSLRNPIAIFSYSNKNKAQNLILNLRSGDKNFLVGLSIRPTVNGQTLEINSIRNVFPKNNTEWLHWIEQGKALYLDKKSIQELIAQQRTIPADVDYLDLDTAAKIVNDFENPAVVDGNYRSGSEKSGERSDTGGGARASEGAMRDAVSALAEQLGLDNVDILSDGSGLQGRQKRAKGFFSRKSGKITIVLGNHSSVSDAIKTLLHEAVAHYGLRALFKGKFSDFLDNVYRNASKEIRAEISALAAKHGWDFETAVEEYLAKLAENTNFEQMSREQRSFWGKVKHFFGELLSRLGLRSEELTDNDLRYILWSSYENLRNKGPLGVAEDVAMREELGIGKESISKESQNDSEIVEVNETFNNTLSNLNTKNANSTILSLGNPSSVLLSAGVANKPLRLYGNKIYKKLLKHGFNPLDLKNLPLALSNPIFVFNTHNDGSRAVLTDLKIKNNNLLVAIKIGKGGADIDFNIITSTYGKGYEQILNWLNKGYATYINEEKAQSYLDTSAPIAGAKNNSDPFTSANVANNSESSKESSDDLLFRDDADEGDYEDTEGNTEGYTEDNTYESYTEDNTAEGYSEEDHTDERYADGNSSTEEYVDDGEYAEDGYSEEGYFDEGYSDGAYVDLGGHGAAEVHDYAQDEAGKGTVREKVAARDRYEARVGRTRYQVQEALQDSMLGLKEAMDAVLQAEGKSVDMRDVAGFENAYLGENKLSSMNQALAQFKVDTQSKPMPDPFNDQTNPDSDVKGILRTTMKCASKANRALVSLYITRTPDFDINNYLRDKTYTNTMM